MQRTPWLLAGSQVIAAEPKTFLFPSTLQLIICVHTDMLGELIWGANWNSLTHQSKFELPGDNQTFGHASVNKLYLKLNAVCYHVWIWFVNMELLMVYWNNHWIWDNIESNTFIYMHNMSFIQHVSVIESIEIINFWVSLIATVHPQGTSPLFSERQVNKLRKNVLQSTWTFAYLEQTACEWKWIPCASYIYTWKQSHLMNFDDTCPTNSKQFPTPIICCQLSTSYSLFALPHGST